MFPVSTDDDLAHERHHRRAQGFGPFIRAQRCQHALSQASLARRTGLHRTSLRLIEHDGHDPRLETLVLLARAFDVTPAELVNTYAQQAGMV
jgi:transcriptional regulator with XRE-family HTH domain